MSENNQKNHVSVEKTTKNVVFCKIALIFGQSKNTESIDSSIDNIWPVNLPACQLYEKVMYKGKPQK